MDQEDVLFGSVSEIDLEKFITLSGEVPREPLAPQAERLLVRKYNYPYQITWEKDRRLQDNYNTRDWPRSVRKAFWDKYLDMNPGNIIKFKKFSSEVDGYMSVAQRLIFFYKQTKHFTAESDVIDEYYAEAFDIYKTFMDEVLVAIVDSGNAHTSLLKCMDETTEHISRLIEDSKLTPNVMLKAYMSVMYCLDIAKDREMNPFGQDYRLYTCESPLKTRLENDENTTMTAVPFITPRGVFGTNTFLACYYNGIYPIGITTNPAVPHGVDLGYSSYGLAAHDLDHKRISALLFDDYFVYQHILTMTNVEKAKGLIYILFMMIHEAGPSVNELLRLTSLYWYDFWYILIRNEYYTLERYNISLPESLPGIPNINLLDPTSKGFRMARLNNARFYEGVETFMKSATLEMVEDYNELKKLLIDEINAREIVPR